jgi:hypothetical protein
MEVARAIGIRNGPQQLAAAGMKALDFGRRVRTIWASFRQRVRANGPVDKTGQHTIRVWSNARSTVRYLTDRRHAA